MFKSREDLESLMQPDGVAVQECAPAASRPQEIALDRAPANAGTSRGSLRERCTSLIRGFDLTPDLGADVGSKRWFRGLGTLLGLSAAALTFWPNFSPLEAAPAMAVDAGVRDEFRSQMIMPLAYGADSGRHMGATQAVNPLLAAPERPQIQLLATLARGDSFKRMLLRAGVGSADAGRVIALVGNAVDLSEIAPGTQVDITLGSRPMPGAPRPLAALSFRARFDLELAVSRNEPGAALLLDSAPIRVDNTPLRIRGTVGDSLYRSARAAGAPASVVQDFLKELSGQIDLDSDIHSGDTFDIIVAYRRAATGERQAGQLLYAGIERAGEPEVQLMRWGKDGQFYEASGAGQQHGGLLAPVPGRITSSYGMRLHPILGYRRMHRGVDFHASYGTPIHAPADGRVIGAGRMGGCGIAVKLRHGSGLATRFCHMSRMAVHRGQSVQRGQVIGYVGSTGLATGAHLHYEMYRAGHSVDPQSVEYVRRAQLAGAELRRFRAKLTKLKTVDPGAALAVLRPTEAELAAREPHREIDKLAPEHKQG